VLQCVAVCCRVLQFVAEVVGLITNTMTLDGTMCYSVLHVLQCVSVCYIILGLFTDPMTFAAPFYVTHMLLQVLLCVAVCRSVLQCVAVCRSVLQCVAVCCSVLQCVAVCCSVLQWW